MPLFSLSPPDNNPSADCGWDGMNHTGEAHTEGAQHTRRAPYALAFLSPLPSLKGLLSVSTSTSNRQFGIAEAEFLAFPHSAPLPLLLSTLTTGHFVLLEAEVKNFGVILGSSLPCVPHT